MFVVSIVQILCMGFLMATYLFVSNFMKQSSKFRKIWHAISLAARKGGCPIVLTLAVGATFPQSALSESTRPVEFDLPIEFFATATLVKDASVFDVEYDARFENPQGKKYKFWGLKITDFDAVNALLRDRALKCSIVYSEAGVGAVDCSAWPEKGTRWVSGFTMKNKLNLFTWLPQLGLAERYCDDVDKKHSVYFREPNRSYFCDGSVAIRSYRIYEFRRMRRD